MSQLIKKESNKLLGHAASLNPATWVTNPYIKAATSQNTRKAYQSDIRHFENWGGRLPATTEIIIHYLQTFADKLNPRTLARRITALKSWHQYQGFPDPTSHPALTKTLLGITRLHGKPKAKARPLLFEELIKVVTFLEQEGSLKSLRDNALLQIGFLGAFRRSELVAIQYEQITWSKEGIEIILPHSKTDQLNEGQYCAIPYGNTTLCPITVLKNWLDKANIEKGPIFRRFLMGERLGEAALTPLSVNHILKARAEEVGLTQIAQLSSHSLRRGFATCAAQAKANLPAIMRQARWKHVNTALGYIEAGERFQDNAATDIYKLL